MNFDALTVAAVRDELREKLSGGRVERVLLPDELAVGLEFYAGGRKCWLLASAHPQHARVHLASAPLTRASDHMTPLLLLLRKYVRDARLTAVSQPALERVLYLDFRQRDEEGEGWLESRLVLEVMGRYSNIILVDAEGVVLDAAKRVTAEVNRYRVTLPRHPYVAPPPQEGKADPRGIEGARLRGAGTSRPPDSPLWRALVEGLGGVSPLLAREIAFRATGDPAAALSRVEDWERVAAEVRTIFAAAEAEQWEPCVAEDGGVVAFAPYRLRHLQSRPVASISEAVDLYFSQVEVLSGHEQVRESLQATIAEGRERLLRKKEALERALAQGAEADRLRRSGESIFAYAHSISPRQTELVVDDLRIRLDPNLSPVENAQAYFRDYAKARAATEGVPALLERVGVELAYLDEMAIHAGLAEGREALADLREELAQAGYLEGPARGRPDKGVRPRRARRPRAQVLRSADGMDLLVGRSGQQNEEVTFGRAVGTDLWLHARGVPGAHVVVKALGSEVPESTIRQAAALAAWHSQARGSTRVAVDYTLVRHVKRIKGAPPGMVTYTHERTIHVAPAGMPAATA